MDPIARMVAAGAAGAAGGSSATYVDDVFSTTLYTSNASSTGDGTEQVITTGIDHTEGFLTWIKQRAPAADHVLFDSERIGTNYKWLYSNETNAEQDTANIFKNPTSTGFTVRQDTVGSGVGRTNPSGSRSMASWNFRKAPGFFDIVTWTGDTTDGRQIPHELGSTPGMVIIKRTDSGGGGTHDSWHTFHRSEPTKYGALDSDRTFQTNVGGGYNMPEVFGNSSSVIIPDANNITVSRFQNRSGASYIAYIFAHDDQRFGANEDEAIIKCGSFTTDSSTALFDVNLGFEPQWLMYKRTDSTNDWAILDTMRDWTTRSLERAFPNTDQAPFSNIYEGYLQPYSQGFRSLSAYFSANAEYVYMAIRRPNKPPEAGTDVFAIDTSDATSPSPPQFTSGFVTDFIIRKTMDGANATMGSRMVGVNYMSPYSQSQESTANLLTWDFMDGWSNSSGVDTDLFCYMFKRAPGFFDVVAYTGNNSTRTITHNLNSAPEMMIFKLRAASNSWIVYHKSAGATHFLLLNTNDTPFDDSVAFNDTDPTASVFTLGNGYGVNANNELLIAYLFASLSGISKVGSYSGTGNAVNVDCGFTAGARFVLIKRTDSSGDWYVWDTTNGIVSGNDPYWRINQPYAAVTNTDYIDPLNAGFTVTSSAPAALNANGGTYIFLAIA